MSVINGKTNQSLPTTKSNTKLNPNRTAQDSQESRAPATTSRKPQGNCKTMAATVTGQVSES